MKTQRPSGLDFSPEAPGLDVVPDGSAPPDTGVATGVGTLPGSSGGSLAAPSGAAAQSGASPPMKGVHVAPIPPWKGCEISRVNGAADQMRPSATRSKPNAAWSVHAGDAFAFLASGPSAGHGTARRDHHWRRFGQSARGRQAGSGRDGESGCRRRCRSLCTHTPLRRRSSHTCCRRPRMSGATTQTRSRHTLRGTCHRP